MASRNQVEIDFLAKDKVSKVINKIDKNTKKLDKTQKFSNRTLKDLKLTTIAYVAAALKVVQVIGQTVEAYKQQVFAEARLEQALKTQNAFTEMNLVSLKNLASQLQRTTIFSDEQTISAQALLASFKLNAEQIGKMTPLMQDLATMTAKTNGGMADLEGIAKLMGLALEGQAGRLKQAGVSLTDLQVAMIDAADRSDKFNVLLQVMEQNAAGLAGAVGETAVSGFDKLKNALGDTKEAMGELAATSLMDLVTDLNDITLAINNLKLAGEGTQSFLEGLKLPLLPLAMLFDAIAASSREFNKSLEDLEEVSFEAAEGFESLDVKFEIFGKAIKESESVLKDYKDGLKELNDELKELKGRLFEGEDVNKRAIIDKKLQINQLERERDALTINGSRYERMTKIINEHKEALDRLRNVQESFSLQREKATIEIELEQKAEEPRLKGSEDLQKQLADQFALIDAKKIEIKQAESALNAYRKAQNKILQISQDVSKANKEVQNQYNDYVASLQQNLPTELNSMNRRVEQARLLALYWERIMRAQRASSETLTITV